MVLTDWGCRSTPTLDVGRMMNFAPYLLEQSSSQRSEFDKGFWEMCRQAIDIVRGGCSLIVAIPLNRQGDVMMVRVANMVVSLKVARDPMNFICKGCNVKSHETAPSLKLIT